MTTLTTLMLVLSCLASSSDPEPFSLGVAAGDVTADAAVLWTRADHSGTVRWEVAADSGFAGLAAWGEAQAAPEDDLVVQVEARGLQPGREYFYRFRFLEDPPAFSRTGRFRTAPDPAEPVAFRFAISGDSGDDRRPFDLLRFAAGEDLDFFVYLGDTIYADEPGAGNLVARTLDEYRRKYRWNRADGPLRDLLAATAVWAQWDDHEIENDYAGLGLAAGGRDAQLEAGYRAFLEYLPVRRQEDPRRTYRRFRYGAAAEFFILDNRQYRQPGAAGECGEDLDPFGQLTLLGNAACREALGRPRSMLGSGQLEWLKQGLAGSTAAVKFVLTSVPIQFVGFQPYDRWDGYDAERRELLSFIDARRIAGVFFLTTDFHANAYNPDVTAYFRRHRPDYGLTGGAVCPEIIAGPIAQATLHEVLLHSGAQRLGLEPESPWAQTWVQVLENSLVEGLMRTSGQTFIETDRYAYAVVDVQADGTVHTRFRGLVPPRGGPDPAIETIHEATFPEPPPVPCALPAAALLAWGWRGALAHRRRTIPAAPPGYR